MPENGSLERFSGKGHDTHRCSPSFRPGPFLSCEHMFSSLRTSPLAQRTLGALDLARSFLMLEDDYGVDWEVDRNEPDTPVHPHRAPLRGVPSPARRRDRPAWAGMHLPHFIRSARQCPQGHDAMECKGYARE
jgi:hypothetical protein